MSAPTMQVPGGAPRDHRARPPFFQAATLSSRRLSLSPASRDHDRPLRPRPRGDVIPISGMPRGSGCWVSKPPPPGWYQPSPPGAQRLQSVTEPPPWPRPPEPCPHPRSPAPAGAPRGGEGRPGQECAAGGRRTQEANGGTCKGTSLEQPPSAQAEPSGASGRAQSQCAAGLSGRKAAGGTGQ